MTSKFNIDNRELLQRISSGEAVVGIDFGNLIVRELAAFRLAAMDSESGCLPLDYLQGHKDGLEWAAQLAEANHPETGDWLYDDPIELAKAIRKGPDMPPVQPVADSEPVAWTWHYREQWHVTNDKCRAEFVATDGDVAVLPLYRHAQPAQEYPEVLPCPVLLEPGMRFGKGVKIRLVLEAIQRRAEHCAELEAMTPDGRAEYDANIEAFKAMLPQPAPLVPDGYVMVPKEATEKMLIAGLEEANPLGGLIDWDASRGDCNTREQVQEIFKAMLAAAPQEVK